MSTLGMLHGVGRWAYEPRQGLGTDHGGVHHCPSPFSKDVPRCCYLTCLFRCASVTLVAFFTELIRDLDSSQRRVLVTAAVPGTRYKRND